MDGSETQDSFHLNQVVGVSGKDEWFVGKIIQVRDGLFQVQYCSLDESRTMDESTSTHNENDLEWVSLERLKTITTASDLSHRSLIASTSTSSNVDQRKRKAEEKKITRSVKAVGPIAPPSLRNRNDPSKRGVRHLHNNGGLNRRDHKETKGERQQDFHVYQNVSEEDDEEDDESDVSNNSDGDEDYFDQHSDEIDDEEAIESSASSDGEDREDFVDDDEEEEEEEEDRRVSWKKSELGKKKQQLSLPKTRLKTPSSSSSSSSSFSSSVVDQKKGCFLITPKKITSERVRWPTLQLEAKIDQQLDSNSRKIHKPSEEEAKKEKIKISSAVLSEWRKESFEASTQRLSQSWEALRSSALEDLLQGLSQFIKDDESQRKESVQTQMTLFVPAALVIGAGLNLADHKLVVSEMLPHLFLKQKICFCSLQAQECTSFPSALNTLVEKLSSSLFDGIPHRSRLKILEKIQLPSSMSDLLDLYSRYESVICSLQKDNISGRRTLLIIFEDVECFAPEVLSLLISVLYEYRQRKLPVVAILGVATDAERFRAFLPLASYSHLDIDTFFLPDPISQLELLIFDCVFDPSSFPLYLGYKTFSWLLADFESAHLTAELLVSYLKFILLEHFSCQPFSFLCCPNSPSTMFAEERNQQLSHTNVLELLEIFPSVEGEEMEKKSRMMAPEKLIAEWMSGIYERRVILKEVMGLFFSVVKWTSLSTLNSLEFSAAEAIRSKISFAVLIGLHPSNEVRLSLIQRAVRELILFFRHPEATETRQQSKVALKFRESLENIEGYLRRLEDAEQNAALCRLFSQKVKAILQDLSSDSESEAKEEKHKRLKKSLFDFFKEFLRPFNPKEETFNLFEVCCYTKASSLRHSFGGGARRSVMRALIRPQVLAGSLTSDDKSPGSEDCGLILDIHHVFQYFWSVPAVALNLADWFSDFQSRINSQSPQQISNPREIQARFVQCLNEMRLLGLIENREVRGSTGKNSGDYVYRCILENM